MVKECEVCGKEFEQAHGNQKYCSGECRRLGRRKWNREYYLKNREEQIASSRDYYRKFVRPYKKRQNCTNKHDCLNCPETEDCVYAMVEEKGGQDEVH